MAKLILKDGREKEVNYNTGARIQAILDNVDPSISDEKELAKFQRIASQTARVVFDNPKQRYRND